MRKPKEQVDEEGNEAALLRRSRVERRCSRFGRRFRRDPRKPKKPARQRVELRNEQQSPAAPALGLGRLRRRTTSTRSCSPAPGEPQAQAQESCRATGAPGLGFVVEQQPDDVTCGPACLHGLYRHYGDDVPLAARHRGHPHARHGRHARRVPREPRAASAATTRRSSPTTSTCSIPPGSRCRTTRSATRLASQAKVKPWRRLQAATRGYDEFLRSGGKLELRDLEPSLLRRYLRARPRHRRPERHLPLPSRARHPRQQRRRRRPRRARRALRGADGLSARLRARS